MLWEIVIANLICASVTGGIIACYHYYRLKKEQEYYNEIRSKVADYATVGIQCMVSYMAAKGYSDASALKAMLENNPEINSKFQPWVDPIMQHAADISPHYNMYEAHNGPTSQFYKDFVVKPCPYTKSPMFMDQVISDCPKHKYGKIGKYNKDFDCDSLDSMNTEIVLEKIKKKNQKSVRMLLMHQRI